MSVVLTHYVLKYFITTLYYNITLLQCINLSYRHMSAAGMRAESTLCADCSTCICEDSTRMRSGSIRMRVQNLYFNI
jgi:hypothetical protein